MNNRTRRTWLYGAGGLVLAGLCYGGFLYRAEPDLWTLLGAANMQLRLAHGMPALDRQGLPLAARTELLDGAAANLDRAAAIAPDSPLVGEFAGFLRHLRGDPRGAAACYRRARGLADCDSEQHDTLVFNEARMLQAADDPAGALAVLAEAGSRLQPRYAPQLALSEAELLHALGRDDEAAVRLRAVLAADDPMAWVAAGLIHEQSGRPAAAVAAFQQAASRAPIADYHLARLKLAAGEADTCLQLLERAAAAVPAEVRRLVREDPHAWQGLADDVRFRQLVEPPKATPGR
jgi:tetratricopeptide (TPR) repeat protein